MTAMALIDIIKSLIRICGKEKIKIVFMGGIAASVYSRPRATFDVDAIMLIDRNKSGSFFKTILKRGFAYDQKNPVKIIQNLPFISIYNKKHKIYADIFLAESNYQKNIIKRAKKMRYGNILINLIAPEDLILLKLLAGRQQDIDDVRQILIENYGDMDVKYLHGWARKLSVKTFLEDEMASISSILKTS